MLVCLYQKVQQEVLTSAERTAWASVASDNNVVVFAAGNNGNEFSNMDKWQHLQKQMTTLFI
jgi:hypothetical protein